MLAYKRLTQLIKCDMLHIRCPTVGRDPQRGLNVWSK